MKETGLRNGAHGADKFGFKDAATIHWNLPDTVLVEHAIANREGFAGARRRVLRRDRRAYRPQPQGQVRRRRRAHRENGVVGEERPSVAASSFKLLFDDFIAHAKGKDPVCAGPLWRRRL